jgi:CBS domain-containing protein/ubiquinone/menaquinone biosynthesis C-methylase UbiE
MFVSEFMQVNPVSMSEDRPIRDAVRLIFNLSVSAILVVKDKKPIGIITEEDILQRLFPSVRDFMEDFTHARSFAIMEDRLPDLMSKPVKNLMTSPVQTLAKDAPLMKALSMMLINNFSHIPVVNDKKELTGMISQGDIFRAIASSEIPYDTDQEYHDWIARHFDLIQGSAKRYELETEDLDSLLKKYKVQSTLNLGSGTGSHDILLAEKGYKTTGVEKSRRMYVTSTQKKMSLPPAVQERVNFLHTNDYQKLLTSSKETFDAALFLGNALAHMPNSYEQVLKAVAEKLKKRGSILVLEIANFHKVLGKGKRLNNFTISPSRLTPKREFAFLEFYDPVREGSSNCTLTMGVFAFNGRRWAFRGVNSTPLAYITQESLEKMLPKLGFSKLTFYGSRFGEPIFDRAPKPDEDDWLTMVAER